MQKSITVTDPRRVELELASERDMPALARASATVTGRLSATVILRLGKLAPLVSTVIGVFSPKLPCQ